MATIQTKKTVELNVITNCNIGSVVKSYVLKFRLIVRKGITKSKTVFYRMKGDNESSVFFSLSDMKGNNNHYEALDYK